MFKGDMSNRVILQESKMEFSLYFFEYRGAIKKIKGVGVIGSYFCGC
jgi:hypothetical protein